MTCRTATRARVVTAVLLLLVVQLSACSDTSTAMLQPLTPASVTQGGIIYSGRLVELPDSLRVEVTITNARSDTLSASLEGDCTLPLVVHPTSAPPRDALWDERVGKFCSALERSIQLGPGESEMLTRSFTAADVGGTKDRVPPGEWIVAVRVATIPREVVLQVGRLEIS